VVLEIDYQAAKRLVELCESLSACAGQAIDARRAKLASALNALLTADADDYAEAQRIVQQHDREETARVERRAQAIARERFGEQMLLAPRRDRAVGAL
jgi:hypothetical protein